MTVADDGASRDLAPNDPVANALLDYLDGIEDAAVARVLNAYVDDREASPNWTDYRRALDRCPDVVGRWPSADDHGTDILVRAGDTVGLYQRVPVRDTATAHAAQVSGDIIETLVEARGAPELVPLDDVHNHFLDGGLA
ncbi:hypothetical protein EGH21_22375 [Halomicroarcula sp. F13]|uniref:Uncharacterized protein n=1 Tax=Haloarcula rubra TaxID=2487747 RepID=A0AAW4PZT6_9EURY|nr:hypothetical protein [Halomicroarcula rubra]MBX0325767.1 hypothetical protein [Halomicroarcula rubra]